MEMDEKTINMIRHSITAIWVVVLINWVIAIPVISTALHWTGIGLVAAHIIELGVFYGKIKRSENKLGDALQIFIYGYFHAVKMP